MKKIFAIPTIEKKLCAHFGHCQEFALVETENNKVISLSFVNPPVHQPGVYPRFLAEKGVHTIISGGMGMKAQEIFAQNNIEVLMGVGSEDPKQLVEKYLDDLLESGDNLCDH